MSDFRIAYKAPGPVAEAFLRDRSDIACIMGPIGSAKTSTALMKIIAVARGLRPCLDGVRRCKALVLRNTYPNLDSTTLATWHLWVPRTLGRYVDDTPRLHELTFVVGGERIELAVEFRALGEHTVEDALRGWEGTCAYINEADQLPAEVLTNLAGRIGRYPPAIMGGCSWSGIWLDLNAPAFDSWIYDTFIENPQPGYRFFNQPGGLEPDAENIANLPGGYGYYERLVRLNELRRPWWVERFVHNRFGQDRSGKPVYPAFQDRRHVAAAPLEPARGLPLVLGTDAGGTPATTLWQRMPDGQWRGLDEVVTPPEASAGPTAHGEAINRLLATPRYAGWPLDQIEAWVDPSATAKGGRDEAWTTTLAAVTKIRFRPAPTNDPSQRIEAVTVPLRRTGENGGPMVLISPTMKTLRRGFNSHYRYRKKTGSESEYSEEPEKNHWSHVHDAAQYAFIGGGEHLSVQGRARARRRPLQTTAVEE